MPKKPKVAIISTVPTPYRNPLFERLAARTDMDIKVFFLSKVADSSNWHMDMQCNFPHQFLKNLPRKKPRNLMLWFHPELPRILREGKFDVVVISGYAIPTQILAALWCIIKRVPYIFISESHDRGNKLSWWRRILRQYTVKPLLRRASANMAVGSYAKERLVKSGVHWETISLLLNSPDVEKWISETNRYRKECESIRQRIGFGSGPVILFVGRMVPEKGVEDLIEAYSELIRNDDAKDSQLLLLGEGPLLEPLRKRCMDLGLKKAHFVGFVAPEDLYPYYAASDIFVLPSRYEPFGVVIQEAAAARLPLIVSDCCGAAPELLHEQENGFIFRASDSRKLMEAMITLLKLKDKWGAMGEKSRALASHFDYKFCEKEFMKAIGLSVAKR